MADWSVVAAAAVTGVTSVASGALGYMLAQNQARAEQRAAREARREQLKQDRKQTYHAFLDIDRKLPARLTTGLEIEPQEFHEWLDPFNHSYNALILLGTEPVAEQGRALFTSYMQ